MSVLARQRQWRLLEALHGERLGLGVRALLERLETSRATLSRDLRTLRAAGFPVSNEMVNGEARYRLRGELPPIAAAAPPSIVAALEQAMLEGRRLAFLYAGAPSDEPVTRRIDPLALQMQDGHLYVKGFDADKRAVRSFELVRMSSPRVLDEPTEQHPAYEEARRPERSSQAWEGPAAEVTIRMSPRAARYVAVSPLVSSQRLELQEGGTVLVHATVTSTVAAMRWVLRWGKDACVIAPAELRDAVLAELRGAIDAYAREGVSDR